MIRERFRREAKAAQKLAHPNIIEIFDQGETPDGYVYLVMELLRGETLADVLEHGKVPLERGLPIMIQIARALARAHDLEVIHRDLKPENIFLARLPNGADQVKLLDFGIARSMQDSRLTGAGEVFGTPQYMAPERITSIEAGPRGRSVFAGRDHLRDGHGHVSLRRHGHHHLFHQAPEGGAGLAQDARPFHPE
ncbi:MAG: serine/threonine-protein kinase [Gammaproteobacteria bacterium]